MVFSAACKEAIEQKFLAERIVLTYSQNSQLTPSNLRSVIAELVDLWISSQQITEVLVENLDRLLSMVIKRTPLLWKKSGTKIFFFFLPPRMSLWLCV